METEQALKNAKFDSDFFSGSNNSNKHLNHGKKQKQSKKKGQDFDSYAKEKGINFELKYEEDKIKRVEKKYDNERKDYKDYKKQEYSQNRNQNQDKIQEKNQNKTQDRNQEKNEINQDKKKIL